MLPIINLPEDTLQALGNLTVQFNHLEAVVEQVLIQMLGMKFTSLRSHVPFANMSFSQRLEILEPLLGVIAMEHGSDEPLATYVSEIRPKLTGVNKRRNELIHSRWAHVGGKVQTSKLEAKGELKLNRKNVTTKDLVRLNGDISDAANAVWNLVVGGYGHQASSAKGTISKALQGSGEVHEVIL
jgi:hypothetical protein